MPDCNCGARGIDLDGHECVAWLRLRLIERDEQIQGLRTEHAMDVKAYNDKSFELRVAEQQLAALGPWTVQTLRQYVADTSEGFECLTGCDSFGHQDLCPVTNTVAAFRLLREQLSEYDRSFDLYDDACRRGTALWRDGHPERDLILPDTAKLVAWLLAALADAQAENAVLREAAAEAWSAQGEIQKQASEARARLQNSAIECGEALGQNKRLREDLTERDERIRELEVYEQAMTYSIGAKPVALIAAELAAQIQELERQLVELNERIRELTHNATSACQALHDEESGNERLEQQVAERDERIRELEQERGRLIEAAADEHDKGAEQWRMNQTLEQDVDRVQAELKTTQAAFNAFVNDVLVEEVRGTEVAGWTQLRERLAEAELLLRTFVDQGYIRERAKEYFAKHESEKESG